MKNYTFVSIICLVAVVLFVPQVATAQVSLLIGPFGITIKAFGPQSFGASSPIPASAGQTTKAAPRFIGATTPTLFSGSGLAVFDGAGHVVITDTVSVNGSITRYETYTGTYTVNSNGLGSLTVHSGVNGVPVNYDFVVVSGGTQLLLVGTDQGIAVTGIATKQ